MATLRVDSIDFHFQPNVDPLQYDSSTHYRTVFQKQGKKAVDVVVVEHGGYPRTSWLLEVKDYRVLRGQPRDFYPSEIAEDLCRKVTDTLDGLSDASVNAQDALERQHALRSASAPDRQIIFHFEPYIGNATRLFPKGVAASVLQRLKQNPLFGRAGLPLKMLKIDNTRSAGVPWTAS